MATYTTAELLVMSLDNLREVPFVNLIEGSKTIWKQEHRNEFEETQREIPNPLAKIIHRRLIACWLYEEFGEELAQTREWNAMKVDQMKTFLESRNKPVGANASVWDMRVAVACAVCEEQNRAEELEASLSFEAMTREQLKHRLRRRGALPEDKYLSDWELRFELSWEIQVQSNETRQDSVHSLDYFAA